MPDIRLVQDTADFRLRPDGSIDPGKLRYAIGIDWALLGDGTLDDDEALATAVVVALGTDRLALPDDILPDPDSSDRAGWWGDLDAEDIWDGWPIGSRLWLLRRDKIAPSGSSQGSTIVRVKEYIRECIQPFIDRRIASRFIVEAERVGRERIDALVRIYRGPRRAVDLRFQILWDDIVRS